MVAELLALMDKDGDGEIDYREFVKQFGDRSAGWKQKAGPKSKERAAIGHTIRAMDEDDMAAAWKCLLTPTKMRTTFVLRPLLRWTLSIDLLHGLRP